MKKQVSILTVLLLSLFLVSCFGGKSPPSGPENYKTGIKDLELDFLGDEIVYQEEPMNLFMQLKNNIAYDINNVKVSVVGLDEAYINLQQDVQQLSSMEGIDVFNPSGEIRNINFAGNVKNLPLGAKEVLDDYRVEVEYISNMEFSPEKVCVGSTSYFVGAAVEGCPTARNKDARNQKLSFSGQGAPLAVTEMEVISGHDGDIRLILTLRNKGKGEIKKVVLGTASLGVKEINCEFRESDKEKEFIFTKDKKEATLICNVNIGRSTRYETTLFMDFIYNYQLKEKQRLVIKS